MKNKSSVIGWAIVAASTASFILGTYFAGLAFCASGCGYVPGFVSVGVIVASVVWFVIGILIQGCEK